MLPGDKGVWIWDGQFAHSSPQFIKSIPNTAAASTPLNQPGDVWLWGEPKDLETGILGSSFSVTH